MSLKKTDNALTWKDFFNPFRSISVSDFLHSSWQNRIKQTVLVMNGIHLTPLKGIKNARPDGRFYVVDYFMLATRQWMTWLFERASKKAQAYLENRRYSYREKTYHLKVAALLLAKYVTKGLYLLWTYPIRYTFAALLTPIALLLIPAVSGIAKCARFCMDKSLLFTLRVKTEDNLKNDTTSLLYTRLRGEKYYSMRDLNVYFDAKKAKCLVEIYSTKLQRNVTYSFMSKNPSQLYQRINLIRGNNAPALNNLRKI